MKKNALAFVGLISSGLLSCGDDNACYSPTSNLSSAGQSGAVGCACNPVVDKDVCAQGKGLMCISGHWTAVVDGPCMPAPGGGSSKDASPEAAVEAGARDVSSAVDMNVIPDAPTDSDTSASVDSAMFVAAQLDAAYLDSVQDDVGNVCPGTDSGTAVDLTGGCPKSDCEKAGGTCEQPTPGGCLGLYSPNSGGYSCGSGFCCLPLRYSPCESGGGKCVQHGTCTSAIGAGTSQYVCSNSGGGFDCCLPFTDGGT